MVVLYGESHIRELTGWFEGQIWVAFHTEQGAEPVITEQERADISLSAARDSPIKPFTAD